MGESREEGFYDAGWETQWRDLKRYSPMGKHTRRWIRRLISRLPQPRSIVDIGCGEGALLEEIGRAYPNAELFGCDFSSVSVEASKRRVASGRFAQHDLRDAGNPFDRVFDVATCSEVIEHVDDDVGAVTNMASWATHLVLTVPGGVLDDDARAMGHLRHYDERSLRRVVEAAGMNVLECRTWGFPLAYPLYARIRNKAGHGAVVGSYSLTKRLVARALYLGFYANDLFRGGNKIFLLARARPPSANS